MSGKLPYLTVELIILILESCTSISTVAVAARCSRRWYNIATPLLYRRVDVINPQDYEPRKPYLKSLAVLFLSKPDVAALVQHFSLRPGFGDGPQLESHEQLDGDREWDSVLSEKVQRAINSISLSDEERATWLSDADYDDTFLALLLPALPNLVSLDLITPCYAEYLERMLWRFRTIFTNLKSLFWTYRPIKCLPVGAVVCPGIFAMPSINNIHLHLAVGGHGPNADDRLAQFSPRTSTCTLLELRDCRFNPNDIQSLFLIPKALSTFIYEIGRDQLYYGTVSFPVIRQGLELHKGTLQELCLDYCHDAVEWDPGMIDDSSPMKPLHQFLRLRHLRIAPVFVLGANLPAEATYATDRYLRILDFLPNSIQQLQLTHCEQPNILQILLDVLANIFSKKTLHVPILHQLTVEIDSDLVKQLSDEFKRILKLAEGVNTNLLLLDNFGCSKDRSYVKRVERNWGFNEDIEWKKCHGNVNYRSVYKAIVL